MKPIPFEIIEQLIQCFGKCFHYKDNLNAFLVAAGIESRLASKYKEEAKYIWGRNLLREFNETEEGIIRIKKIISAFYQLRDLPDKDVANRNEGLSCLRKLKELIKENEIIIDSKHVESISRQRIFEEKEKIVHQRIKKLDQIKKLFFSALSNPNRQQAGYSLEEIIKELFALSNIEYKQAYKTETQQIDGYFRLEGFDYLVEAKWRTDLPNEGEIGSFKRKIDTKLDSTRGLFISINGFREEVIKQFNGNGANIIFFTGEDLTLILEGRIDLVDVLIKKIEKAAQYGISFTPVKNLI